MTYIASQSGFSFVKILLTKAIFSFFFSLSPPYKPINLSFSHIQNLECGWLCCKIAMEVLKVQVFVMYIVALALACVAPSINAQVLPPAPAPTSDGIAVDQGIAYVLMLLALVLTYIIH